MLLDDGETVRCDGHDHVCPVLWLAIRSCLVRMKRHQDELGQAEARVHEALARLMEKNPDDRTH
jgi:hypothetical protein